MGSVSLRLDEVGGAGLLPEFLPGGRRGGKTKFFCPGDIVKKHLGCTLGRDAVTLAVIQAFRPESGQEILLLRG